MSAPAVAEFDDLGKEYHTGLLGRGRRLAVERVTFRIESGEVFGLVGPNRAGKTTLVKVLLSLCRPTSGRALRFQRPLSDRQTLARVGYVHENPAFPRYLSARRCWNTSAPCRCCRSLWSANVLESSWSVWGWPIARKSPLPFSARA